MKSIFIDIKNKVKNRNKVVIKENVITKISSDTSEPKKIIGIGGGGSNIAEFLSSKYDCLIVNSDKKSLDRKNVKNKVYLETKDNLGCGSNEIYAYSLITDNVLKQIDSFLDDYKSITLIATLGGGVGSGSTKAIANYLTHRNINVKCILVKPFSWEGNKKANRANETIKFLKKLPNIEIQELSNDELIAFEHLSFKDSFNFLNNKIMRMI